MWVHLKWWVPDCVNSSPPLILREFQGFGGIWANSGEFGNFGKIQGNSVGLCMALSMNSVGIPGGFWGNAGFSGKLGVWGGFGRFGGSKGFCANSQWWGAATTTEEENWLSCQGAGFLSHLSVFKVVTVRNFWPPEASARVPRIARESLTPGHRAPRGCPLTEASRPKQFMFMCLFLS